MRLYGTQLVGDSLIGLSVAEGAQLTFSLDRVVEVRTDRDRGRGAKEGAWQAAIAGLVLGLMVGQPADDFAEALGTETVGPISWAFAGALGGAFYGAIFGALIGSRTKFQFGR
jgi:uncharacterized protein YqgC (DUF456 family)